MKSKRRRTTASTDERPLDDAASFQSVVPQNLAVKLQSGGPTGADIDMSQEGELRVQCPYNMLKVTIEGLKPGTAYNAKVPRARSAVSCPVAGDALATVFPLLTYVCR